MPRGVHAYGFKKGESGNPTGRPKGSKNKLNYNVGAICQQFKCNPFEVLCLIANGQLEKPAGENRGMTLRLRMEAAAELAQYLAPKLKAIEHSTAMDEALQLIINTNAVKNESAE